MTTSKGKAIAMKKILLMWLLVLSCGAQGAYAAAISPLTMTLSSGGQTIVITDQNVVTVGGDMSSAAGSILFMGTVGTFNISLAAGVSYPSLGGPTIADLNLANFNVSSAKGGVLTVTFADTGYSLAPGTLSASATSAGLIGNAAAGSSVSVQSWIDPANSGGAAGTQVLANSSSGPTFGFSTPASPFIYGGGPFSIYTQAVINLTAPVSASAPASANLASDVRLAAVAVPEPGSLVFLSAGLFLGAIVVRGRKRKRDRAT